MKHVGLFDSACDGDTTHVLFYSTLVTKNDPRLFVCPTEIIFGGSSYTTSAFGSLT